MAVARPSVYRARTPAPPGGGGYATGLGQALGQLADVAERRRTKSEIKKSNLALLSAKDRYTDWYNQSVAAGVFDGQSADEVRSAHDARIAQEVATLAKVDEEAAAALDYELSQDASRHVAGAYDQERQRSRAEASATLTNTQRRIDVALGENARAMAQGSTDEQMLAFEGNQVLHKDWQRAVQVADLEEADKIRLEQWFTETAAHHRRTATVNEHVRGGTVDDLLGRIANRTDYYSGTEGERLTSGMTPDEVAGLEDTLRQQATQEDNRRAAELNRLHTEKVRADQVAVAKMTAKWIEDGMPDPTAYDDAQVAAGRGDLAVRFMGQVASYGNAIESAEQTRRKNSPEAEVRYQDFVSEISTAEPGDFYSLNVRINNAASDTGTMDQGRASTLLGLLGVRQGVVDHREQVLGREQAERERAIDRAAREVEQSLSVAHQVAEGALAFSPAGGVHEEATVVQLQQSLRERVPAIRAFVEETGADPVLAFDLVATNLQGVQAHTEATTLGGTDVPEWSRDAIRAAEQRDRRTLDLLASKGFKREALTEQTWLGLRMDEGLYAVLAPYFDPANGRLADADAMDAMERHYGVATAAVLYERNLEAHRRDLRHVLAEVPPMEQMETGATAMRYRSDLATGALEAQLAEEQAQAARQEMSAVERAARIDPPELGISP